MRQEPILSFKTQQAWEEWLAQHHAQPTGIWLKLAKKGVGTPSLDYPQALEGALIYGWIDGQKKGLDDQAWLQRFSPRGTRSLWSQVNVEKVCALEKQGRMTPAGLAAVAVAKENGAWDRAYAGAKTITVPKDLQAALARNPKAQDAFSGLSSANRYAVLWRVHTAKKAETRARRIGQLVDMLARGETLH